jgi:hypothetical protein
MAPHWRFEFLTVEISIPSEGLVLSSVVRVSPISLISFHRLCPTGETDPSNWCLVLVLLIGIGVWKPPPQSPSSFKASPHQSQGVPCSLKVLLTNPFPIYFLGQSFWFFWLQCSPSMSTNLSLVDWQVSSLALHICESSKILWRSVRPVWKTG